MSDTPIPAAAGTLHAALTPAGAALLDLLTGHLPGVHNAADHCNRTGTFPGDVFKAFGESGVLGATVPRRLGGLGLDRLYDVATALLTVAEVDASTALALHAQFSRGLTFTYEWLHGEPHARQLAERVLRAMALGDPVSGGVKEHPSAVTTITPDGHGGWRLNGRTTMVTMAPVAKHIITVAQTRGDGCPVRLATVLVSPDNPGVTVLDNWDGLGMRASGTVDVLYEDAGVPGADVLVRGAVGAQHDGALAGQTVSSITMLGIYLGVAQAARDWAVRHVARGGQAPPAAVRPLVAEIDARLYMLRATAGSALLNADTAAQEITDVAVRGRSMMVPFQYAKLMVNRHAPALVDDCLTLVGGATYSAGHPLARMLRDIRANNFMQPYNYIDGVEFLSAHALDLPYDSNYISARAARSLRSERSGPR
ncbi:acyl-CoA dehydrogenase family protein [Actinoplanes siamensis]|uniref:Acyl-CoA dehydrogenase n=1 Tax=Actinoplanes siamensis TaxID=1223317 RepID=A0A919NA57_9ACTN|nr:acyl-CoA dehydrogenase family protein [Actinoplanes siamensis]GIF07050.1 acyl-CoA dehydrogenase [Actinoplanes siamensis]